MWFARLSKTATDLQLAHFSYKSRLMTKPTKWHVCPAKTQNRCPVWSESLLSTWRKLGSLATHWVHSEDSDQTGQMPKLIWVRWAHMTFCWFYHAVAHNMAFELQSDQTNKMTCVPSEDWADTQAVLCLPWAHKSFCWFYGALAHLAVTYTQYQ